MSFPLIGKLKKVLVGSFFPHVRRSYSQSGEDIIISDLFNRLGISNPTYLDIGANDPISLNNTYRLYTRGGSGVCIEPNPVMYKRLLQKRPKDTKINAGVAFDEKREAVRARCFRWIAPACAQKRTRRARRRIAETTRRWLARGRWAPDRICDH